MRYKKYLEPEKTEPQNAATATRILDAARRLFLEKGFQATTTRDIATEAGVTLGLLPYYYKTKENLAHKVAYELMEQFYRQFDHTQLRALSSAEQMYALNLLIYERMFTDHSFGNFLFELAATTETTDDFTSVFWELSLNAIREYKLSVTEEENRFYITAIMGSRKMLLQRYWRGEIPLSYEQLNDLMISNYLYNIGLPDEEIARVISVGRAFCASIWDMRGHQLHEE